MPARPPTARRTPARPACPPSGARGRLASGRPQGSAPRPGPHTAPSPPDLPPLRPQVQPLQACRAPTCGRQGIDDAGGIRLAAVCSTLGGPPPLLPPPKAPPRLIYYTKGGGETPCMAPCMALAQAWGPGEVAPTPSAHVGRKPAAHAGLRPSARPALPRSLSPSLAHRSGRRSRKRAEAGCSPEMTRRQAEIPSPSTMNSPRASCTGTMERSRRRGERAPQYVPAGRRRGMRHAPAGELCAAERSGRPRPVAGSPCGAAATHGAAAAGPLACWTSEFKSLRQRRPQSSSRRSVLWHSEPEGSSQESVSAYHCRRGHGVKKDG